MSAPSGSGPTYLPLEYEYYYLEFVNWQNNNQGGGVSYNRTKNIINEPTFDDVNIIGDNLPGSAAPWPCGPHAASC